MTDQKPSVLFVCVHNAGRSQMAAGWHARAIVVQGETATSPVRGYVATRSASGTTGQPKGVIRDNGGHMVALAWTMRALYGIEPGEVFFETPPRPCPYFRLGYSTIGEADIARGIELIARRAGG